MIDYTDHLARTVSLSSEPERIISLCPSITETLFDLGVGEKVVGRTRFCIHPQPAIQQAKRIGGTKSIRMEEVRALKPDLIIAEKEENTKEMVGELERDFPVVVFDVKDISSALNMIQGLGTLCNVQEKSKLMTDDIQSEFGAIDAIDKLGTALYMIWREPFMVVGKDTYIQDVLARMGVGNLAIELEGRYPAITSEEMISLNPDMVLLSSEPYPFMEKHITEIKGFLPRSEVILVDGEMFSWYGTRMKKAVSYLESILFQLKISISNRTIDF